MMLALLCEAACSAPRTVDEARTADDAALSTIALGTGEVALIADGSIHRVSSIEQAIQVAASLDAPPVHAYVAVGGRERSIRRRASALYAHPNFIGNEGLSELGITVQVSPAARRTVLAREGEARTVAYEFEDGAPVIRLRIRAATSAQGPRDVDVLVASGFGGGLFLAPEAAKLLCLERSEEPGIAEIEFDALGKSIACRRALVSISIPELGCSAFVSAVTPLAPSLH